MTRSTRSRRATSCVSFVGHALDRSRGTRGPTARTAIREGRATAARVLADADDAGARDPGAGAGARRRRAVGAVDPGAARPSIAYTETIESLHQRLQQPRRSATRSRARRVHRVEDVLDRVAEKLPALRRARNLSDGKASLNRQELDQILDHMPLLEAEGFEITLPGSSRCSASRRASLIVEARARRTTRGRGSSSSGASRSATRSSTRASSSSSSTPRRRWSSSIDGPCCCRRRTAKR